MTSPTGRIAKLLERRALVPLIIASVLIIAFVVIGQVIRSGEPSRFDLGLAHWVHGFEGDGLDAWFTALTQLGSVMGLISIAFGVSIILWWRGARFNGALVATTSLLGGVLNTALKLYFARARPELFAKVKVPGYSFPSGHAMGSMVVFGISAVALAAVFPRYRVGIFGAAAAFIFMIGLSRIYLGVHWPTDVLGGYVAGAVLVIAAASALRKSEVEGSVGSDGARR